MKDLYLEVNEHKYYYQGEAVDCVSDMLKIVDCITMKGIPHRNLEIAAERGTRVHNATEDLEYGMLDLTDDEWRQQNDEIYNYCVAYVTFMKDHPEIAISVEESMYSKVYEIAGTVDLVKHINGKIAIIDKKTTKTVSELRSSLQLNMYRIIWNELHPDLKAEELYILQLKDNGTYRFLPISVNEDRVKEFLKIFKEIKGDKKI
jgi:hypothetical protein